MESLPETGATDLGQLVRLFGSRTHGVALLLLALPDSIPIPVPSVSAVLGVPMLLISLHLLAFGEQATLPRRLNRVPIPAPLVGFLRRRIPPLLRQAERVSHPRWQFIAGRERLIGLASVLMALLLLMPLPLFNTPPALCLVLLAWGMVQRDGAFVIAGLAGSMAILALLGLAAGWVQDRLV
jgi:hypothetical protein